MALTEKSLISAELGLSHEGSLGFATKFIESCAGAGVDLIKFQMHFADAESSAREKFRVNFSLQDKTRWDYWKRTEFTVDQWKMLFDTCIDFDVAPQVTVFSYRAIEFCQELGIDHIKLGSGDLDNLELGALILDWYDVNQNLSLTISTGMASMEEIDDAIKRFEKLSSRQQLIVLQCTSMYPTPLEKVGLSIMSEIRSSYGVRVGLSDHSVGLTASMLAISMGADLVERHVVFDRRMFGPDTSSSITLDELQQLTRFRDEYRILSKSTSKNQLAIELNEQKKLFGRSLALKKSLPQGSTISSDDFCLKKPSGGYGWENRNLFLGKALVRDYDKMDLLEESHVE